ncbi:hypothetical protein EV715DRAFT_213981 [Schizophyllum commune]
MGQWHQALVIAKIKPHDGEKPRYRCLGSIYHSWCYGSLPVKGAHRFITLIKQELNARIVQEELDAVQGKYGAYGKEEPKIPDVPCPYTTSLLNMAFNVDHDEDSLSLSGRWFSSGSYRNVCSASMGCWSIHNDDGLTIIDITHPLSARYCFLRGRETQIKCSRMKPLNAREYLTAYYRDEDKASGRWKSYEQLIALMDDFALVSEGALGQSWPKEYREQRLRTSYDDELDAARARRAKAKVKTDLAIGEVDSEPCNEALEVPSLASLILGPSIKQALETGDAAGAVPILQHAENIPKMMEAIHSVEGPFPEVSVPVLATTIEFTPGGVVDLSGVQLTGDQLLRVLPADKPLDTLDVSGNTALDGDGLRIILEAKVRIRRLIAIRTNISDEAVVSMLDTPVLFAYIDEFIHPLLYSWRNGPEYPCAFSIFDPSIDHRFDGVSGYISVAIFSVSQIAQNLRVLVDSALSEDSRFCSKGEALLEAGLTAGVIPQGKAWGERPVWCTAAHEDPPTPRTGSWKFYFKPGDGPCYPTVYGFRHYDGPSDEGKVPPAVSYSLDDFLKRLEEDGYPAPSPDDMASLRETYKKLKDSGALHVRI